MIFKQFGAKSSAEDIDNYNNSDRWDGTGFRNMEPTYKNITFSDKLDLIFKQMIMNRKLGPENPLELSWQGIEDFTDRRSFQAAWFGHSAIYLKINTVNILIDPMMGDNAAPISPFPFKRFSENTLAILDDIEKVDLVLISHDHYDHLDYKSIQKIKAKNPTFFVALGVKKHLVKWGIEESKIVEFDWWQSAEFNHIRITFTPTRHFSGRYFANADECLWGGWAIQSEYENVYFSGDGGYGQHFEQIGRKLGPFDFGFIESGQYHHAWRDIHLYPEQSIQAARDAWVKKGMPVHWGAFSLAPHYWNHPPIRFSAEAKQKNFDFFIPNLGARFDAAKTYDDFDNDWWLYLKE